MSRSRVEKLKALLARVEQRRAEPRLAIVPRPVRPSEPTLPPVGAVREPVAELYPARAPAPIDDLSADQLTPEPSSLPPPPPQPGPVAPAASAEPAITAPPTSTVPPEFNARPTDPSPRATTEVLPAAPARIAPSPPTAFDSAVRAVSSPRIDAPKSFGELLEVSLSLRPK